MRRTRTTILVSLAALMLGALNVGCAKKTDDAQLATTIKAQMFSDPQTKDSSLQVAVKDGVVTLSGTLPSDAARYEAYKLASSTPGVTKVNDETVVQAPGQQPTQTAQATPAPEPPPVPVAQPAPAKKSPRRAHHAAHHSSSPAQAASQSTSPPETTPAPAAAPTPEAAAPAPPPPPQPLTATFPAGTTVEIQTIDPVDSSVNHVGDEFQATLAQPLSSAGVVVVPAGTNIYMRLTQASTSGQYKGRNELQLQLARLEFNGRQYPVVSTAYTEAGGSRGKNTAEKVGGGAAIGAIIGAIAGGGKGAAIGAGVGGAGGGVYQGVTKVKPLRIAPETKLDFRLDQPLNITYMPRGNAQ
ncbi:MAG: BON domain-containing protein [Candidatus Acidiferrales bacterium]